MSNIRILILSFFLMMAFNITSYAIEPYKTITLDTLSNRAKYDMIKYSDSGNYIIATKKNGNINVWDAENGNLLKNYPGDGIGARSIASNRYGTRIMVTYPNKIVILKMDEYKNDHEIPISKTILIGDINNSGGTMVIGYEDGSVQSLDSKEGSIRYEFNLNDDSKILSGLKYSLGSERLLITYQDGTTIISDNDLSDILLKDKDDDMIIKSTLSEDSTFIVSIHPEGKLKVRSIFDFGLIVERDFIQNKLNDISANYFTSKFYLIGDNNELTELVFDKYGNLKENPIFISQLVEVEKLDVSPKNKTAAIINNKGQAIKLYDFESETIKNLATNAIAEEINVIESGTEAFAILSNNRLIRFNISTGKVEEIDYPLPGKASNYIIDTDNVNRFLGIGDSQGKLYVYKYSQSGRDTNRLLTEFQIEYRITSIDFLTEKQWVLIGSDEGYLYAYDLQTNFLIFKIGIHNGRINQIQVSKDEKYVFSVGDDGYVVRSLLEDNYDEITRKKSHDKALTLSLSNDESSTQLITGGSEGKITIWSTRGDFRKVQSIGLIKSSIYTITYLDTEKIINILENDDYIIDRPENEENISEEMSDFVLISTESGLEYLIKIDRINTPQSDEDIDNVDIKIMHVFSQSPEPIRNTDIIEDSSFLISVGDEGKINIYDTNYILGFGYSSAGLYKEARIFIDKSYRLNDESNNFDALIRDRQEQARILTRLGQSEEAIEILKEMNSYLEVNPISLEPKIEDTTIQKHKRPEDPIKGDSIKDEKLESRIIEDYKYVVLKPKIEDYKYITQQQLAFKEYSSPDKFNNIVDNYIHIGDIYLEKYFDYTMSRAYYMKAIDAAKRSRNKELIALAYYKFALCTQKYAVVVRRYGMELEADTLDSIALINIYTGLDNALDTDEYRYIALGHETYGDVYSLRKDYLLAEEYYNRAYQYYKEIKSEIERVNILKKIIDVSIKSEDIGKTISYFNLAVQYSNELTIYRIKGLLYNELAKLFMDFGHYRNSLEYARKAYKALDIHGSTYDIVNNYLIQAQFFLETGDFENSYKAVQYSYKIALDSEIKSLIYAVINRLGFLEYKRDNDNIREAFNILIENLENMKTFLSSQPIKAETYYLLYLINKENDFEEEYIVEDYLKAAINLSISMYTDEYDLYKNEADQNNEE